MYNVTIRVRLSNIYYEGSHIGISNYEEFLSLKIILILPNSVDSNEMQQKVAFHQGLNCLPKYPFYTFSVQKGLKIMLSLCR